MPRSATYRQPVSRQLPQQNRLGIQCAAYGATEFKAVPGRNVLLFSDSVVYGGNAYRQQERLGPKLQALMQGRGSIWRIAAGSWALRNELAYLRLYPQVLAQVDQVVFVLNSGDFGEASSWSCELTHPRFGLPWRSGNCSISMFTRSKSVVRCPLACRCSRVIWRQSCERFLPRTLARPALCCIPTVLKLLPRRWRLPTVPAAGRCWARPVRQMWCEWRAIAAGVAANTKTVFTQRQKAIGCWPPFWPARSIQSDWPVGVIA
jgi:hypothetical protein